ncbi:hypothetical protein HZS_5892 [Henneguya salminicola]|nr:hypothetical protein HZS_5892 [Henneguya salminicola]
MKRCIPNRKNTSSRYYCLQSIHVLLTALPSIGMRFNLFIYIGSHVICFISVTPRLAGCKFLKADFLIANGMAISSFDGRILSSNDRN